MAEQWVSWGPLAVDLRPEHPRATFKRILYVKCEFQWFVVILKAVLKEQKH